jgi:predicted nucleic acid-binding protein
VTRNVLADTSPLYALADPSDQYHERAAAELEAIERRGFSVAATYATLCETHTLVLRRLGISYARQWIGEILGGAILLNPEPSDYMFAAAQLDRFVDHSIAVTAVLAGRLRVPVWSFDRHFTPMRAKLWR